MGEGFYNNTNSTISAAMDESNGNESPKKRARTGSLSDHGTRTTKAHILMNRNGYYK